MLTTRATSGAEPSSAHALRAGPDGRRGAALPGVARVVAGRWPAALGLGLGLLSIDGLTDGVALGAALAMAAFGYLLVTLLARPWVTWPAVLVLGVAVVGLRAVGIAPVPVLAVAAAVLAAGALAAGWLRPGVLRQLQAPAAWVFGGVALAATLVSAEVGSVLVAVGLLAHAGWDAVLWRARPAPVSRSFVEWCAVFDVVVGGGILWLVV